MQMGLKNSLCGFEFPGKYDQKLKCRLKNNLELRKFLSALVCKGKFSDSNNRNFAFEGLNKYVRIRVFFAGADFLSP